VVEPLPAAPVRTWFALFAGANIGFFFGRFSMAEIRGQMRWKMLNAVDVF
jgi:hypothetical protein